MVTAVVAEATRYGVTIKRTSGQVISVHRASLADSSDPHGINRDDADEVVERAGYVAGVWRWQTDGSYYKSVVTPESAFPRSQPSSTTREGNMRAFGNPEGRKWTDRELAARQKQVRLTGKTTGWEKWL